MTQTTFSPNGHKRAVLYARVSSDDTKKDGRNLQSQLEMCKQYATERDYRIAAELHEDDRGASGASFELPQLGIALAMAERGEYDVLVVRELDRLSRNLAKQLNVEEALRRSGVSIEYVLSDYPDTPEGKLNKLIRATVAEYERDKIKERNVRGLRNVVKNGRIMLHSGKAPYGYRPSIETRNGRNIIVGLEIYEPEARIVRLVFEWYTLGDDNGERLSTVKVAKRLTDMRAPSWGDTRDFGGVKKSRAHGTWSASSVSHMLHNEVYKGIWHYGKLSQDREQWLTLAVPAIVTPEIWQAAQRQCQENTCASKRGVVYDYLMRSRLQCGCGQAMVCQVNNGVKPYLYYHCVGDVSDTIRGKCGAPYFRADHVDTLVWAWLKQWFEDPVNLQHKLEIRKAELDSANAPVVALLKANDNLIADNKAQLNRLLDLYLSGTFEREMLTERKARLEMTIAKLEQERHDLQARLGRQLSNHDIDELKTFAYNLAAGLEEADKDFAKRRKIVELLNVRGILTVENGERICYVSLMLTGQNKQRIVLPKRGRALSVNLTNCRTWVILNV